MWKEEVVANLGHYPNICLWELRKIAKTSFRISGLRAEV
jgi:hypothetical protein